jgi:hypothetical protein
MATFQEFMLGVKFLMFYAMEFTVVALVCFVVIGAVVDLVLRKVHASQPAGPAVPVHTSVRS